MIEGVFLHPLKQVKVCKGDLWHVFKSTDVGYKEFGEVYLTQIESGKIKGWKCHCRYILNLVVVYGKVKFVVYDSRDDSLTKGQYQEIILSPDENYQRLTIFPNLWMAFMGVNDGISMVLDLIPEIHDPTEALKADLDCFPYSFSKTVTIKD